MNVLPTLQMKDTFFNLEPLISNGIEEFIRGSVKQLAQEVDVLVHPALRNFLFTAEPGEEGFDLIALNLQRSRDHAIPLYNDVRQLFRFPRVTQFSEITGSLALQNKLQSAYGTVDCIEAWIGLIAEDHVRGSSMRPTLLQIWRTEFARFREVDRFFFEQQNVIPSRVARKLPWVRNIKQTRNLMREIILRNSGISSKLPQNIWMV